MKINNLAVFCRRALSFVLTLGYLLFPVKEVKADNNATRIVVQSTAVDTDKVQDGFYIGYPRSGSRMQLLSESVLDEFLASKGMYPSYDASGYGYYDFTLDGKTYTYRTCASSLTCNRESIGCKIYAPKGCDLSHIDNIITLIGGVDSRNGGVDLRKLTLGKNSIVVVCYTRNSGISSVDRTNLIAACTYMMNCIFEGNDFIYNSIAGFSEGAQAAFVTAANNPGLYQTLVCSNGAFYWTRGGINLISQYCNNNYQSFRNMEIIFLESKNNNNWNPYIVQTISDLLTHGVSKNNISIYTNDSDLINGHRSLHCDDIGYLPVTVVLGSDENIHFLTDHEAHMYGGWERHGDGMRMIIESNVLSYLTGAFHTAKLSNIELANISSLGGR